MPSVHSKPKRVLLVDDSSAVRDAVSSYLGRLGHEVHTAADGRGALEVAARLRPQVAFVDLWMPVMDGYEVAERLRRELGSEPRIVAMTAHAIVEARARCQDAGFDLCLPKPLDPAFLESWLGHAA